MTTEAIRKYQEHYEEMRRKLPPAPLLNLMHLDGYFLCECHGSDDGEFQLKAVLINPDDLETSNNIESEAWRLGNCKFRTDEDAWEFVRMRHKFGDPAAIAAVEFLKAVNPTEHDRVMGMTPDLPEPTRCDLALLETMMQIAEDTKKTFIYFKFEGTWAWCDRDERPHPECHHTGYRTFYDALCSAVAPYMEDSE